MSDKRQEYIRWEEYFIRVGPRIRTRRWEPALSATIIRSYLWGTMDFLWDVRMTIFLGVVRESLTITSIFIRHTVN